MLYSGDFTAEVYYVYITANKNKSIIYTGVSTDWRQSIEEHREDAQGVKQTFPGRHNCEWLLLLEEYGTPIEAIRRERQIKSWVRAKKEALISSVNPKWRFLNK
ncbi:GIY-YIG nuclease family protein [Rurimicrobium arvi]|uniref:GIY-YIG nuclease family protein n=1 Tax=Rurimicrobium arvi TaxID=2049916 RepID=A0ABP8N062_9BACT